MLRRHADGYAVGDSAEDHRAVGVGDVWVSSSSCLMDCRSSAPPGQGREGNVYSTGCASLHRVATALRPSGAGRGRGARLVNTFDNPTCLHLTEVVAIEPLDCVGFVVGDADAVVDHVLGELVAVDEDDAEVGL